MMTNCSEEHLILPSGDYILFLNRKGIVSFENITKFSDKAEAMEKKYENANFVEITDVIEINDETNPFDYGHSTELDDLEKDEALLREMYIKFYWIALYTNHKFSISKATEIFEEAEKEYGIEQLISLANQMLEDANKNKYGNTELKKLTALRQTK